MKTTIKIKNDKLAEKVKELGITKVELYELSYLSKMGLHNILTGKTDTTMIRLILVVKAMNSYRLKNKVEIDRILIDDYIIND